LLQMYVDDSASDAGEQRLFLAGYINTAEKWQRFSVAWAEELRADPAIAYLKMSEANSLSGQFSGWPVASKDQKVRGLCRVIRHFEPHSIHCSISRVDVKDVLAPAVPRGFANPYFHCFQGIIIPFATTFAPIWRGVPVEFVFDEQGELGTEALFFYKLIRDGQPKKVRALLSKDPTFGDDKVILPLQAADVLAWHVRRHSESGSTTDWCVPDYLSHDGHHMTVDMDRVHVQELASKFMTIPGVGHIQKKRDWKETIRLLRDFSEKRSVSSFGQKWFQRLLTLTLGLAVGERGRRR
jgi:Protein of unknown function (DUF3800)